MEEKKQEKKCPFFDVCGVYIVQEKIRNVNRITGHKIHEKKWSERFCFGKFKKCVHFEDRKKKKKVLKKA